MTVIPADHRQEMPPEWHFIVRLHLIRGNGTGSFDAMKHVLAAMALLVGLSQPARADESKCKLVQFVKLPVVMEGERATIPVSVNGKDTRIWLDSGAFFNFMPKAKAVELGLKTEPLPEGFYVTGIGGSFTPELARVREFGLLGVQLHNMEFVVGGSDIGNAFLGSNLLGVWTTEFDLAKGAVNLFKENGCNRTNLAYWAAGMSVFEARLLSGESERDHHIYVEVSINGHSLRAMLDTGAPQTSIGSHAAARAGIDLTGPQVVSSMNMGGVGSHLRQSWIVRTKTIDIGGEQIQHSPIRVIDDRADDKSDDMLLGVDFLMAHHVLISPAQRKMFLTYNGGPIFSVSTESEIGHIETRAENISSAGKAAEPRTADEFAGRGSGRLTRGDATGAIADFSAAIKLAPGNADFWANRAKAYARGGHPDLAAGDIDAALKIRPADHRLLLRRARIRLGKGDKVGALADTDAAAAATPKGSLAMIDVVSLYERLGKADRGLALLDPVLDLHHDDSSYANLLHERAWNRALANADLDPALKDCNAAIRKTGPNPSMLDTRALIQLRRKDYPAAIADADAALAKAPKASSTLYLRGLAKLASADEAGAKIDFAAARTITPTIDQFYADYGLAAPGAPTAAPAQPPKPDESDNAEDDDQ
jgi:predicted aspartyl protease/tetratricopeptide (TPR) repeat protein